MKKILVCTTFRDFNGNSNDQIQRLFLNSIKKQTYSNWELIVTIFNEKNVEGVLGQLSIPSKFYYSKNAKKYKFSLTEVLLNGIDSIEDTGKNIIIWTTCDVIFDDNFFEQIIANYSVDFFGTSHPHLLFNTIGDLTINNGLSEYPSDGIDTIFFDADLFLSSKNKKIIEDYNYVNWGVFEHFLVAVGSYIAKDMLNLWGISSIKKVLNDRSLNNETSQFFIESCNINFPIFTDFLRDKGLKKNFLGLLYCHLQFRIITRKKYLLKFWIFYLKYFFMGVQKNILNIFDIHEEVRNFYYFLKKK